MQSWWTYCGPASWCSRAIGSWRDGSERCSSSMRQSRSRGTSPSLTPRPWSESRRLLEGAAERGLRVVANLRADRGDLGAALQEEVGGHLHSPLRQILDRRLPDEIGESLGYLRTRRRRFPG